MCRPNRQLDKPISLLEACEMGQRERVACEYKAGGGWMPPGHKKSEWLATVNASRDAWNSVVQKYQDG